MGAKAKQHIIPACYLRPWCDPGTPIGYEPYIWLISRDGTQKSRRAPSNSFTENNFYTVRLQDGERNSLDRG